MRLTEIYLALGFFFFDSFYLFNNSSKELLMLFQIEVCKSSNVAAIFSHIECAANTFSEDI